MQETLVEQDIANLDLSNVAALQQKRTLAFVNHFVITTVQFLNNFLKSCEHKLLHFERRLEKVNATMVLLEAKLSSIPEVNTAQTPETEENTQPPLQSEAHEQPAPAPESAEPVKEPETLPHEAEAVNPEYEKFVKMVQVGVPLDAVKLKLTLQGLDPKEFERILKK